MIDLSGKVALVTGGSRGIGRAVCFHLARAGANVALVYRDNQSAAEATQFGIEKLGRRALAIQADLCDPNQVSRVFQIVASQLGHLDIFVANAGIWKRGSIDEMSDQDWHETMDANLHSVFYGCREATKLMKPRRTGKLILISSTAGVRGEANYSHYAASKGALIAMVRSLAVELGPSQISVNGVAPGWVETDMTAPVFQDPMFREAVEKSIPLRRIGQPDDIAGTVLFLASNLARHIQGEVINVNGGSVLA